MSQAKIDNQGTTTGKRLVKVAVRINPETIDELRAMYADQKETVEIRMVKIGGWRYPCAIYLLPEDEVVGFQRLQQNEAKLEQREARCWLPNGQGGFIRCDEEKHKCSECKHCLKFNFDSNHPTSYEALQEFCAEQDEDLYWAGEDVPGMKEPAADEGGEPEEAFTEIMEMLVKMLTRIKPKYGAIFHELLKGNVQPLNIAKALGLGKSQIYDDVPKVQEAAKKLYFELRDK